MKKTKTISKLVSAAMAVATITTSFAQSNLGASCGCPPVASRPTVDVAATLADANGNLTAASTIFTCANNYLITKKIYVAAGKSLTIQPGTVVKGDFDANAANASALIVTRDAKIYAMGTEECPVVFTAQADPMNGTFAVTPANQGQWGGVVILGNATNNLTCPINCDNGVAGNKFGVSNGVGFIEGFPFSETRAYYGGTNDDDNSGIMQYVSIRFAGAVVNAANGNEINALTLGSVGRGTSLNHIEVVACKDDGIEFFGGTVDLKYASVIFSNDDMFDYDQGYNGRMQFIFGIKLKGTANSPVADNGFEGDSWDNSNNTAALLSNPKIFNATLIGDVAATTLTPGSDMSGLAALRLKDGSKGEISNSVFACWNTAVNGTGGGAFVLANNTFTGINVVASIPTTGGNTNAATIPGFNSCAFAINAATNVVTSKYDATPNPALGTLSTLPVDGFFSPAAYRGAFDSSAKSWLAGWSVTSQVGAATGLGANCPYDFNFDGLTNIDDYNLFLPKYNSSCQ